MFADEVRQPRALVPGRAFRGVRVAEPRERMGEEFVGRGLTILLRSLRVKRPAVHPFRAAIIIGRHAAIEPLVDKRAFADAAESDEADNVGAAAGPGGVEQGEFIFPAEEFGRGDGEFGGEEFYPEKILFPFSR